MEGSPFALALLLHDIGEPTRLHEHVVAFRTVVGSAAAGDAQLYVGDEVEKGRPAPDRRTDLSGSPLFLAIAPLTERFAASAGLPAFAPALERLASGAARSELWLLKHQFERRRDVDPAVLRDAWLQIVMMNVDPTVESEFNDWYELEHAERISAVAPEFVSVKRMQTIAGLPGYVALWRMTDRRAPERDPWLSASETPWTRRIRRFFRDRRRFMFAPFRPARVNAT